MRDALSFRLPLCLLPSLVAVQFRDGAVNVLGLREYGVFELGRVGDEGVEGGDSAHRRVEPLEKFFGDTRRDLGPEAVRARVLVGDDDLTCLLHARGDRLPVVGRERAQINHFGVDALLLLRVLRGDERALDERAVGDDGQVSALADCPGLREGDHKIVAGVGTLVIGLAVEVLVFEEEDGVVAAYRRAQQAVRVERVRGVDDTQARYVREERVARLRVVDRAALKIPADGAAYDDGALPLVPRTPAHQGQLVPDLMIRGPDVVEELYLDDGLQPAGRHAYRAPDDVGLGERRVEDARRAELALQVGRHLEDAALALHTVEVLLARTIRHVLAEDDDFDRARHLFVQATVDEVNNGARIAGSLRALFRVELIGCGVNVGRVDELGGGLRRGLRA